MSPDEINAADAAIFEKLCSGAEPRAMDAVDEFTRDKMWRLRHIPMKYYLPPEDGDADKSGEVLADLYGEMSKYGYIALDKKGEPCVLSGNEPVLPHPLPEGKRPCVS